MATTKKVTQAKVLTDDQLLEMDLDNLNIDEVLAKRPKATNNKGKEIKGKKERDPMFIIPGDLYTALEKDKTLDSQTLTAKKKAKLKRFRSKVRKQRNRLIGQIINLKKDNNKAELKDTITAFKSFYTTHYINQDYSINSLAKANSDKDTLANIKLALAIIKRVK